MLSEPSFDTISLADGHQLFVGRLPHSLMPNAAEFDALWRLHPEDYHVIMMRGRPVKTPRWQQAFGKDYHYTGSTNAALPIPPSLVPYVEWTNNTLDQRANGVLLNWYDGSLGHYIGKHRDSTVNMIQGAPITTISLGDERIFRLRPWKATEPKVDFTADNGAVFVMPFETNLAWTHEIPKRVRTSGRRISITLRQFRDD